MEQFQIVVSEIQSVRQQMASLNAQIMELKATSEAVTNQPPVALSVGRRAAEGGRGVVAAFATPRHAARFHLAASPGRH